MLWTMPVALPFDGCDPIDVCVARPGLRRIRNHGVPGEFETCPDWVAAMDSCQWSARIILKTMPVQGLDHGANWAEKVRNVSGPN
jgi:hypothetical protein